MAPDQCFSVSASSIIPERFDLFAAKTALSYPKNTPKIYLLAHGATV